MKAFEWVDFCSNVNAQVLGDGVGADLHHLILDFLEVSDGQGSADIPLTEVLVDRTDEFHAEIAVGKGKDFVEAIGKSSFDDKTHQAEADFGILRVVEAVGGRHEVDFLLVELHDIAFV